MLPSVTDKAYHGVKLGRWIAQLRSYRKSGICSAYLTDERIKLLDETGMVWDVPDYLFEKNYAALLDYYKENGNADVPSYYVTAYGLRLGRWIRYQIDVGEKLPEEKKEKLLALGVSFEKTDAWDV